MQDISASLIATLMAAPQISRQLILDADRPFLKTLCHWHDILLPAVSAQVHYLHQENLNAFLGSCAWLASHVLNHGVLNAPDAATRSPSMGSRNATISDELLPLLMDMKSVSCSTNMNLDFHDGMAFGTFN